MFASYDWLGDNHLYQSKREKHFGNAPSPESIVRHTKKWHLKVNKSNYYIRWTIVRYRHINIYFSPSAINPWFADFIIRCVRQPA